jgi:argininosuccinate lyase
MTRDRTLWSQHDAPDPRMMAYTVGDDRTVDARLLRWDVLGSLGHIEALAAHGVITPRDRARLRKALVGALRAIDAGRLVITRRHEDVHSAVELWITAEFGDIGERLHTGRSRNDQVAVDLRLALKHDVLVLHGLLTDVADVLLAFARRHRRAIWPGYTHQRIAMPSSAGLWAGAHAESMLDAADAVAGFWSALDRCPLGSAAGYGVPLPLGREAAARALGFAGLDQMVTTAQNSRGQLEAQVLFWCTLAGRCCSKLSTDVVLFSADEFGWLRLPGQWSTGSSIMPHKRNPDVFELTRGRASLLEGDLAAVLALGSKLGSGYHRDFQLLKAPLWHGVDTLRAMLQMLVAVIPAVEVDTARGQAAMRPEVFATDEVMRRVRAGERFRDAYRSVSADVASGAAMPVPSVAALMTSRRSTGGMGNLPLTALTARRRAAMRWRLTQQRRFERALARLTRGRS